MASEETFRVRAHSNSQPRQYTEFGRVFSGKRHFQRYHLYYVYFMHFPPFSLSTCYMASFEWKQENKRARLHSVQLPWPVGGQNCKHFSTNGPVPPPSLHPCSCPTCPHFPSRCGSHRRPLALSGKELNLFKLPDTSSVHQ